MATTATNTTAKKGLTPEQKEAMRIKREQNPQFANVQSKARKVYSEMQRTDVKAMLLQAKETFKAVDLIAETHKELIALDKATNEERLNKCRKAINFICKKGNENLVDLVGKATNTNKSGLYSVYAVEQTIQAIVKACDEKKSETYESALNKRIVKKSKK